MCNQSLKLDYHCGFEGVRRRAAACRQTSPPIRTGVLWQYPQIAIGGKCRTLGDATTQFATELLKLAFDPMSTHSYALRTNITKALTGVATDN